MNAPQSAANAATGGSARLSAAAIETLLRSAFAPTELLVRDDSAQHAGHAGAAGGGGHFFVRMRSARFAGQARLARHRLVYDALGTLMARDIHALALDLEP
jgi:BolA protein